MFPHIQPDTYCMQQKADKYGSADLAGVGRAQSALPSQKNSRASYDRVYTPYFHRNSGGLGLTFFIAAFKLINWPPRINTETGKIMASSSGRARISGWSGCISSDSNDIASGSRDKTVRIWDTDSHSINSNEGTQTFLSLLPFHPMVFVSSQALRT